MRLQIGCAVETTTQLLRPQLQPRQSSSDRRSWRSSARSRRRNGRKYLIG
jgi:hypothetical protein